MEEKKANKKPGETGAGPRVMKQLLRTPAFKDLVSLGMSDSNPETSREMARVLLWEDAAFSFGIMGNLSRDINNLTAFLDELGRQLQNVPPEMLKEFVSQMSENLDTEAVKALPGVYAPLLEKLVYEDPQVQVKLKEGAAETLNALMRFSAGILLHASEYEPGEGEEIHPDPAALAGLINSLFRWMGSAAGKDPETIEASREKKIKLLEETIKTVDFGVIRSGITKRAEANYPVTESVITAMVGDPIIFANVINILPPLMNNLLRGLSKALSELDFPPEILASAVFNLLDDLEAEEIGAIINGFCRFVNGLHEGSLVLGRDEPRFRPVLQNFLEKGLRDVDEMEAAGAMLALFEDSEVILTVFADVISEKPEMIEKFFTAFVQGLNAQLRGFVYLADKLNQLSPGVYSHIGRELGEKADFKEAAALINALARISNKVLAENPALIEKALSAVYQSVDKEEMRELVREITRQGTAFATVELETLQPEEAGKVANSLLVSYNQKITRDPEKTRESTAVFLSQLDHEELSGAIINTADHLSYAFSKNPKLAEALMRSFYAVIRGALKGASKKKKKQFLSLFRGREERRGGK